MTPEEQNKKALEEEVNQILFKDFKKFADQTRVYIAKEYIALSLIVGPQRETFVLTPYSAKVLSYILSEQVKHHQNQFGGTPFVPPQKPSTEIISPFQQSDLQKPDDSQTSDDGPDKKPNDKPKDKPDKPKKKD